MRSGRRQLTHSEIPQLFRIPLWLDLLSVDRDIWSFVLLPLVPACISSSLAFVSLAAIDLVCLLAPWLV